MRLLSSGLAFCSLAAACLLAGLTPPASAKRAPPLVSTVERPLLQATSPNAIQELWVSLRELAQTHAKDPKRESILAPKFKDALASRCEGLVSLNALSEQGLLAGFGRRDMVRQRDYARPTLALVLHEAMERFQTSLPNTRKSSRLLSIGDVSQVGCGPLRHGVLIHELSTQAASSLFDQMVAYNGYYTLHERLGSLDFPGELDRFGLDQTLIREQRLIAQHADLARFEIRRFRVQPLDLQDTPEGLLNEVQKALQGKVPRFVTRSHTYQGQLIPVYQVVWSLPKSNRRVELLFHQETLSLEHLLEARIANWQPNQPASAPREQRWIRLNPPQSAGPQWERWELVNEAGHASHLSGIDADLSYVTRSDTRHFAIDLPEIDPVLTWRWLETLEATARELKTPVEAIFVDKSIKRLLSKRVPRKMQRTAAGRRVSALLKVSPGHDAHHHIRIRAGTEAQEKAALKRLGLTTESD